MLVAMMTWCVVRHNSTVGLVNADFLGFMWALTVAILPPLPNKKVLCSNRSFLCGVCMFSLCLLATAPESINTLPRELNRSDTESSYKHKYFSVGSEPG